MVGKLGMVGAVGNIIIMGGGTVISLWVRPNACKTSAVTCLDQRDIADVRQQLNSGSGRSCSNTPILCAACQRQRRRRRGLSRMPRFRFVHIRNWRHYDANKHLLTRSASKRAAKRLPSQKHVVVQWSYRTAGGKMQCTQLMRKLPPFCTIHRRRLRSCRHFAQRTVRLLPPVCFCLSSVARYLK